MKTYKPFKSGKVREVYEADDSIIMVATDRISAFDHILKNKITKKGAILTQMSRFWFDFTQDILPNHMISVDNKDMPEFFQQEQFVGNSMKCKKLNMIPMECIVRGYITGSGWESYQENGTVCGIKLPAGLVRDYTIAIYKKCADYALTRGIIIADTKFEFGLDEQGNIVIGDEVLTPDSSRFWPLEGYKEGQSQPSYDKQFVRDWLKANPDSDFELPQEVIDKTIAKYKEAFQMLTGKEFK